MRITRHKPSNLYPRGCITKRNTIVVRSMDELYKILIGIFQVPTIAVDTLVHKLEKIGIVEIHHYNHNMNTWFDYMFIKSHNFRY